MILIVNYFNNTIILNNNFFINYFDVYLYEKK